MIVVEFEKGGGEFFVSDEQIFERRKGVGGDVERGRLDVVEELVEHGCLQEDAGERLAADALAKHGAARDGDVRVLVTFDERRQELRFGVDDIFQHRRGFADFVVEEVVEDLRDVLATLEVDAAEVGDQVDELLGLDQFASELVESLRRRSRSSRAEDQLTDLRESLGDFLLLEGRSGMFWEMDWMKVGL